GGEEAGASPTEALNPGSFAVVGAGLGGVFAAEFVVESAATELAGGLVRATVVGLLGAESGFGASPEALLRFALSGRFCVAGRTGAGASPEELLISALSGRFCSAGRTRAGSSPESTLEAGLFGIDITGRRTGRC